MANRVLTGAIYGGYYCSNRTNRQYKPVDLQQNKFLTFIPLYDVEIKNMRAVANKLVKFTNYLVNSFSLRLNSCF